MTGQVELLNRSIFVNAYLIMALMCSLQFWTETLAVVFSQRHNLQLSPITLPRTAGGPAVFEQILMCMLHGTRLIRASFEL